VSDPQTYRTKEEVAEYQKRDPIIQLGELIKKNKFATDEELKGWDKQIREELQGIEDFAEQSPKPPLEDAWKHVYAD
jgi:pyruvate dehydrogenase E1 component alpha subunit